MALTQTNQKAKKEILRPNQIGTCNKLIGAIHPPQKKILSRVHITSIFEYSPKKNSAKGIAEYSIK